jgi:class 3 adenylate cyclase/tetratricopeptide (TPR) repeat protein
MGVAGDATTSSAGERRHVTVMFSDLSGYTAMCEQLDPEDVRDVIDQVFGVAADVIETYGGRIDRLLGDAVMAVFGDPVAHEDDAERAVRTAIDLHAAIDKLAPSLEQRTGHPLRMHTGINSGVVVTRGAVSHGASGPLGDTVNLAARLDALAGAGEILLGPVTASLVGGVFDLHDAGTHSVKGKAEPIAVARVAGVASSRTSPSRRHGEFVGRQEEFGILLGALERVRDGVSGAITVVGDAGAGKTRLLAELRERAGEHVQWLEGRAYAFGDRIPYAPVIDLISRVAGIDEGDTTDKVARRLTEAVSNLVDDDVDAVLGPLLRLYAIDTPGEAAMDREAFHTRLTTAAVRVIEALAKRAPTVVILQDLHWADPPTVSLMRDMIEQVQAPVLNIFNTRPGFELGVGERIIELPELSTRQTRQLVGSLLDDVDPPEDLVQLIEARADGNPFFVEEIVNSLIESHALAFDASTRWRLNPSLEDASVPSTIRGVIAARIDRLDPTRRRVLQEAAVVGREFLYKIVSEVSASGDELAPSLAALEHADLIREKATDPDLEYLFKHALTQEVAYDGLLKSERQALHEQVARAIETELGHRSGELTETLAHHWLRAGATEHAVHYLRLAGKKAIERYALEEANQFYREAYELLAGRDRTRDEDRALAETLIEWVLVHYYLGDLVTTSELLERHAADFERVDDAQLTGMALAWRGTAAWITGRLRLGVELLDQAIDLGDTADLPAVVAHAVAWKMWALFLSARPSDTIALGRRMDEVLPRVEDDRYLIIKSQSALGLAYSIVGDAPRAEQIANDLLRLGEDTGSSRATAMGHCVRSAVATTAGDWDRGIAEGELGVAAASDPIFKATVMGVLYYNLAGAGDAAAFRAAIEGARELMTVNFEMVHRCADAICTILEGRPARGMRALEACHRAAHEDEVDWIRALIDGYLAVMYARIATREVEAQPSVILRNPGFAVRHALPARRKAHAALRRYEAEFLDTGRLGKLRFVLDYEWAKLLVHEGRTNEARERLQSALDATAAYGESDGRRLAAALFEQLG